jgi:hypothetical protein
MEQFHYGICDVAQSGRKSQGLSLGAYCMFGTRVYVYLYCALI